MILMVAVSRNTLPKHIKIYVATHCIVAHWSLIKRSAMMCQKNTPKVITYVPAMPETRFPINETINDFFQENFKKSFITKSSMIIVPMIKYQKCQNVLATQSA